MLGFMTNTSLARGAKLASCENQHGRTNLAIRIALAQGFGVVHEFIGFIYVLRPKPKRCIRASPILHHSRSASLPQAGVFSIRKGTLALPCIVPVFAV